MTDIESAAPEGAARVVPLLNGATGPGHRPAMRTGTRPESEPPSSSEMQPESVTQSSSEAQAEAVVQPGRVRVGPVVTLPRGRRGPPLRAYPIEMVEWVKALVTGTDMTREEIAEETGVSAGTVRRWTRIYDWERPLLPPPRPRKAPAKTEPGDRRQQLASRVYRNLARQLGHLEKRLNIGSRESAEKDARTLGVLAKTLLTLKELDRDGAKVGEPERTDRDVEELDADLAARIEAWAAGGAET